ncbi:hypothetical protein TREES_T100014965 [Tupaia chinensis]|uniref:Uncharacterized protein n=1 Tax=Tupaia chinensis TaxID=246437 RepID=L9KTQ0_TUPCH|nr:hypothetical protein TREES_T100014965 [Tupaia chinensis]
MMSAPLQQGDAVSMREESSSPGARARKFQWSAAATAASVGLVPSVDLAGGKRSPRSRSCTQRCPSMPRCLCQQQGGAALVIPPTLLRGQGLAFEEQLLQGRL